MSAICSSSAHRTIPANAWWPAAIRNWPSCARTSAKHCWRPPRSTSRRSRPASTPAKLTGQDAIGAAGRQDHQPVQGRQALRAQPSATRRFPSSAHHDSIAAEAALDGIYIIRTSVPATQMEAPRCVRNYKSLANVERAFRSLKTVDLKVRPIHHRLADRVRAHIFLCMLAYYVEWHMREAWRALMFADTDQEAKTTPRSRGASHALPGRPDQGRLPHAPGWHPGSQLCHLAGRTRHHRAQYLPHAHGWTRRAHL